MWAMGASTPPGVEEAVVSRDDVQPGDRIGVRCYPLKDGSLGCALGFVTPFTNEAVMQGRWITCTGHN